MTGEHGIGLFKKNYLEMLLMLLRILRKYLIQIIYSILERLWIWT